MGKAHWVRFVFQCIRLMVGLAVTQTPIGFVSFSSASGSWSDWLLPKPPLGSFRSPVRRVAGQTGD
jgi:hypothetical protein